MLEQKTCRHTPSRCSTLPGRLIDHCLRGETPGARYMQSLQGEAPEPGDVQVCCARCGAELTHPAALGASGLMLACVMASTVTGVLAWLLTMVLIAAGWEMIAVMLACFAVCILLALSQERVLVSAVLAARPWQEITGSREDVILRRKAAYGERARLRGLRRNRRVLDAIFVATVLLQGAKGGALVAMVGIALLVIGLVWRHRLPVLAVYAAVVAAGLAGYLALLPEAPAMVLHVLAATAANAALLYAEENR